MPSPVDDLLTALAKGYVAEHRPWGQMRSVGDRAHNLTFKYLTVRAEGRTSLQKHEHKDELVVIITGSGWLEVEGRRYGSGCVVRIRPGVIHRVTGPLSYLEVSTYDDGEDTIRLEDDYGRPCQPS